MDEQEGEKIFGKRWTFWTEEERTEFVRTLTYMNLQCMNLEQLIEAYEKIQGIDVEARVIVQAKGMK